MDDDSNIMNINPDPRRFARHTKTPPLGPTRGKHAARKARRGELPASLAEEIVKNPDIWRVIVQSVAFNFASCDERQVTGKPVLRNGGAHGPVSPMCTSEDHTDFDRYERRRSAVAYRTSLRDGAVLSLETLARIARVNRADVDAPPTRTPLARCCCCLGWLFPKPAPPSPAEVELPEWRPRKKSKYAKVATTPSAGGFAIADDGGDSD